MTCRYCLQNQKIISLGGQTTPTPLNEAVFDSLDLDNLTVKNNEVGGGFNFFGFFDYLSHTPPPYLPTIKRLIKKIIRTAPRLDQTSCQVWGDLFSLFCAKQETLINELKELYAQAKKNGAERMIYLQMIANLLPKKELSLFLATVLMQEKNTLNKQFINNLIWLRLVIPAAPAERQALWSPFQKLPTDLLQIPYETWLKQQSNLTSLLPQKDLILKIFEGRGDSLQFLFHLLEEKPLSSAKLSKDHFLLRKEIGLGENRYQQALVEIWGQKGFPFYGDFTSKEYALFLKNCPAAWWQSPHSGLLKLRTFLFKPENRVLLQEIQTNILTTEGYPPAHLGQQLFLEAPNQIETFSLLQRYRKQYKRFEFLKYTAITSWLISGESHWSVSPSVIAAEQETLVKELEEYRLHLLPRTPLFFLRNGDTVAEVLYFYQDLLVNFPQLLPTFLSHWKQQVHSDKIDFNTLLQIYHQTKEKDLLPLLQDRRECSFFNSDAQAILQTMRQDPQVFDIIKEKFETDELYQQQKLAETLFSGSNLPLEELLQGQKLFASPAQNTWFSQLVQRPDFALLSRKNALLATSLAGTVEQATDFLPLIDYAKKEKMTEIFENLALVRHNLINQKNKIKTKHFV